MARTKEQVYKEQMTELGIYHEIFDPEIKTLARLERELTRAQKEWSATAVNGGAPSFTEAIYPTIQRLRAEILQHRESLGLTPKALAKLTKGNGTDGPTSKELITSKLDQIAARVSAYDSGDFFQSFDDADAFAGIPAADEARRGSDQMDEELLKAVHEDMG